MSTFIYKKKKKGKKEKEAKEKYRKFSKERILQDKRVIHLGFDILSIKS